MRKKTVKAIENLCSLYADTLDDELRDEWYTTDRNAWERQVEDFIKWLAEKTK